MHRSEAEQLAVCVACGAEVNPRDRPYPCGEDQVLCYGCAVLRNGVYDEAHDRWVVAPHVLDLFEPTIGGN